MEAVEDYLENSAHVKVDIEVLESLLKPGKPGGLCKVRPEVFNEKRQQYFPALRHIREAEPHRGKQKTMTGESREKWCTAREWAQRVACVMFLGNAAKLVVSPRRRRPLGEGEVLPSRTWPREC